MEIKKVHIKQISKSDTFLAHYHIGIEPIKEAYLSYLNKKLKDSKKVPFKNLTDKISAENALKGDVVIKNHPSGKLLIEIIKSPKTVKKHWNIYRITDEKVSPEYLLWHFSQSKVREYLNMHAVGSVIREIPMHIIEEILIPIPKILDAKSKKSRVLLKNENNLIREYIRNFYLDYQENLNNYRYDTAIILAGAICEAILYETLVEAGVPENILSQNKTLGTLIEYAMIKEVGKDLEIELSLFDNIRKHRNKAVHVGAAVKRLETGEVIDKTVFNSFDQIIKNFGI